MNGLTPSNDMKVRVPTNVSQGIWLGDNMHINPANWADLGPEMLIEVPDDSVLMDGFVGEVVEEGEVIE